MRPPYFFFRRDAYVYNKNRWNEIPANRLRVRQAQAPPAFQIAKNIKATSMKFGAIISTESATRNPRFLNADAMQVTRTTISP